MSRGSLRLISRSVATLATLVVAGISTLAVAGRIAQPSRQASFDSGAVWVTEMTGIDAAAASLLLGGGRDGTVETVVAALPVSDAGDGCSARFWIEVRGADLLEGQTGSVVDLEAFAYGLDGDGAVIGFWGRMVHMSLAVVEQPLARSGVRLAGSVGVPCRSATIRYLVRNTETGRRALGTAAVGDADGPPTSALRCLFPSPAGAWVEPGSQAPPPRAAEGLGEAVVPLTSRPVLAAPGVGRFVVLAPTRWRTTVALAGRLRSVTGNVVTAGSFEVASVRCPEGRATVVEAAWFLPEIVPGAYVLEIQLRSAEGGTTGAEPVRVDVVANDGGGAALVWSQIPRVTAGDTMQGVIPPIEG